MLLCPACGSSRIRNDYKPAPVVVRVLGIRALLCDHCNHQFKTFAIKSPKPRAPRSPKIRTELLAVAPSVELNGHNGNHAPVEAAANGKNNTPKRVTIDLDALRLRSKTQEEVAGTIVVDHISPVCSDIRTEITRIYTAGANDLLTDGSPELGRDNSAPACAHCGSENVRRRHRTLMERVAFSVLNHKAFSCRSCGETFYGKDIDEGQGQPAFGLTEPAS
jgi:hypothetical protein